MAVDNGLGVNANLTLSTAQADSALKRIDKEIADVLGNLQHMSKVLENAINNSTGKMAAQIGQLTRAQAAMLRMNAGGNKSTQIRDSATSAYIADNIAKTVEQQEMRITRARVDAEVRAMKSGGAYIAAQVKKAGDDINKMVIQSGDEIRRATMTRFNYNNQRLTSQFNDPQYLAAKQRADDYARQKMMERDRNLQTFGNPNGVTPQKGLFDSVNERFNSNGGSDIIAIQARLMAGYAALNTFFSAVRNGATFIVQLDAELKQFQAITNTSSAEMIGFKDQLIAVAETSKFTAVELAQAATTMGQAGFSAKEVGDTLGSVATLAAASGSTLADSVDVVTSAMSIFNLQTKEAADLANTLTASLNLSKLSIDKIALSLQYAGNIAAESGVGYKELLSVIGTMSNSGIMSGSTLGTGLRQLMIDIQNPTQKFKDALESVGLTEQDVSIRTKTLTGVLRTLHDAGFGTAQAFQSFEVRAASAFAALDGNLDSITDMNEQLINSSAAVEANARQMESLSNKWSRLGSTAGITLDKLFGGFLETLKQVVDGLAAIFALLNDYAPVLKVIGTLFAGAFSALILTQAAAALRGITVALMGMTGATKGAQVAFFGLNLAMRANPWLLLITAITTGVTLISQFSDGIESTAEKLDRLTGEVNKIKGEVDATSQTIKALNDTSAQLMAQRAALEEDPILRRSRIAEVIDAFKELSLEIDGSTASAEKLIDAVDRLTQKQMVIKQGQLELERNAQQKVVDAQAEILRNLTQGQNTPQLLNAVPGSIQNTLGGNESFRDALGNEDFKTVGKMLSEQIKAALPNQFDVLSDQAMGLAPVNNINELIVKTGQLKEAMDALPAEGSEDLRMIYQGLYDTLQALIPAQQKYNAEQAKLGSIAKDLGKVTVQNSPQSLALAGQARGLIQGSEDFMNSGLSRNKNEQLAQIDDYQKNLQAEIDKLTKAAEAAGGAVLESFRANILPGLNNQIATLDQMVSKRTDDYFKVLERTMKRENGIASTKITTLSQRTAKATTQEMVETLMDEAIVITNIRRQALKDLYAEKMRYANSDSEHETLAEELRQQLEDMSADETRMLTGMLNRVSAINEEQLRGLKENLDDQIQAITTKINENVDALKKLNPGVAFDTLKASTQKLIDQLALLTQQSQFTGLQLNNPSMVSGNYKATSISGDQQNRIVGVMNQLMSGYTDTSGNVYAGVDKAKAAGIIGHLMQESGVTANGPPGDDGLANGMAQWHPDRYKWIQDFIAKNGLQNDEIGQTKALMAELQTKYPRVWEELQKATTPEDATRAFAGFEGFKDWNKPTLHAKEEYDARINNALGAYSIDSSKLANVNALQTNVDQASNPGVSRVTDAIVDAAEEKLKTQLSQAKIGGDPAKILEMQDTIDEEFANIVKQRTEEFTKINGRAPTADDTEFQSEMKELNSEQLAKTSTLIDNYWSAVQQKGEDAVKLAQLKLDEAQKQPEGTYTGDEMAKLQNDVTVAQRAAQMQQLAAATQLVTRAQNEAAAATATYGANSEQVRYWSEQEAQAKQKVTEATNAKNAADAATAKQGPTVVAAIQNANQQWAIQNGLMRRNAQGMMEMVPLAEQVGAKWGEVLTGMTENLSTLFVNLASGTMSAKDAMKQFALSTVQMFMQMIAKALAMQLIMSTLGKVGTGGGFLSGLIGVPGMALGGYIKGAAGGEYIADGLATRDSTLRKVQQGEYILRRSAVQQVGRKNLDNINSMGNRRLSASNPLADNMGKKKDENVVNVWVVSPDEKPQMGPNDVVAIVGDNIQRNGGLKKLIKRVQLGE